jgi:hypothetical protein
MYAHYDLSSFLIYDAFYKQLIDSFAIADNILVHY